jgi:hypothetical protein
VTSTDAYPYGEYNPYQMAKVTQEMRTEVQNWLTDHGYPPESVAGFDYDGGMVTVYTYEMKDGGGQLDANYNPIMNEPKHFVPKWLPSIMRYRG